MFGISAICSNNEGLIAREPMDCDTLIFKDIPLVWTTALDYKPMRNLYCIECGRSVGSIAEHLHMAADRAGISVPESAAAILSKDFHKMKRFSISQL